MTRPHLHYDCVKNFPSQRPIIIAHANPSHKSQIICQKSISENTIFQEDIKECVNFRGERNEHMHICIAHVSRSCTIQIILQTFSLSFFTLSPDLYEILDSVRSDPYIQFYFFGPNKKMRVKMPNLRRNITISNGEVFFSTPFTYIKFVWGGLQSRFHFKPNLG